jgi:hypothetical protein
VPHARGNSRRELLARKLRQHYRGTPYCAAIWQARERDGRRDDIFRFVGLTKPELVDPWIEILAQGGIPLAGVCPLPVIGAFLARKLRLRAPHMLLVASTSAGLRMAYFRDGRFALTRLAPPAAVTADDISNMRLYLQAVHAAALDEPLSIVVVDPHDKMSDLDAEIRSENPALECRRIGSRNLASKLRLECDGAAVEVVFLHLLALGGAPCDVAPPTATAAHRRERIRRSLYAATAALACVTAVAAGYGLHDAETTTTRSRSAMQERMRLEREVGQTRASGAAGTVSPGLLREAVELEERIRRMSRTPTQAMSVVAHALSPFPDIAIAEFTWSSRRPTDAALATPANRTATASTPAAPDETVIVVGEVRVSAADHAAAVRTIRAFTDQLGRDPAVREVRIARLPARADPGLAVSGHTGEEPQQDAARFSIEFGMRSDG